MCIEERAHKDTHLKNNKKGQEIETHTQHTHTHTQSHTTHTHTHTFKHTNSLSKKGKKYQQRMRDPAKNV